ncbi:putative nucleic acid-binding protein [Saccharothrix ecbatanensis]|uniref:Putative nucleic acid-binding protein n=1 Tax=Saccharothrix ecbatanensis TaxID=1105145 RepID=A0A7W9HQU3_9PSEU|nr:hypothetical protein [Saccharothrix ecbatanensis]MBB5806378.1 putative nucleic acid-binding protein [Saccharothrix ecbatanensis]
MTPPHVLDTGPLSHFAKQQWPGVLRAVVNDRDALIPDAVEVELRAGVGSHPHLQFVVDASWLQPVELVGEVELEAYAKFSRYLVVRERNRGEAAVLALASISGGVAVVDDSAARKVADRHGVEHIGTLGLLCESIRSGLLTVRLVAQLADHLLEGEYRLPFLPGGFEKWAADNGLVG